MAKIVILTSEFKSYVPATLKEKAEAAGHDVTLINPNECYIGVDTAEPYISYNGTKFTKGDIDICIPRLMEDYLDYKIAILSHLEKMGVFILNSSKSMRTCIDKLQSQIIFANECIKTPKTAMLTSDSQIDYVAKYFDEKFPLVVKTLFGSGGVGVAIVDSFASFKSVAQILLDKQIPFLIQEYIKHEASYRIIVLGDKVLASNVRKKKEGKDFRTNSHQGSDTEKYDPSQAEIDLAFKLAKLTNTTFAAIDYILDGDDIFVLEINGSPGLENIQKNWPDKDLAGEVIKFCESAFKSESDVINKSTETKNANDHDIDLTVDKKPDELEDQPTNDSIISGIEPVVLKRFNDNQPIESRVDTGAGYCSIHGENIVEEDNFIVFTFNDVRYKVPVDRKIHILSSDGGRVQRSIIKFAVIFNNKEYQDIEFTVTDREHLKYSVLIGRNLLSLSDSLIKIDEK
jgi:ribosomal protein S6--L-glutamate ligase